MTTADEQLRQYLDNNPELKVVDYDNEPLSPLIQQAVNELKSRDWQRVNGPRHPALKADPVIKDGQPVARQSRQNEAQTGVTEKDIQDAMIDLLRVSGWLVLRVNGGSVSVDNRYVRFAYWYGPGCESDSGISDIIAMRNGRCILVEVKRPDKRSNLSPNQKLFQQAALDSGVEHYVLCSADELATVIDGS